MEGWFTWDAAGLAIAPRRIKAFEGFVRIMIEKSVHRALQRPIVDLQQGSKGQGRPLKP